MAAASHLSSPTLEELLSASSEVAKETADNSLSTLAVKAVTTIDEDIAHLASILSFEDDSEDDISGYVSRDGTFSVKVSFNSLSEPPSPLVIFAVDCSASMLDFLPHVKNFISLFIQQHSSLSFRVIRFATKAKLVFSYPEVDSTLLNLEQLTSSGNTNYEEAFKLITDVRNNSDKHAYVVFISNGLPTVGELNNETLLTFLEPMNKARTKIITVGLPGIQWNCEFLQRIGEYSDLFLGDLLTFFSSLSFEVQNVYSFSGEFTFSQDVEIFVGSSTLSTIYTGKEYKIVGKTVGSVTLPFTVDLKVKSFFGTISTTKGIFISIEFPMIEDIKMLNSVRIEEIRREIVKTMEKKRKRVEDSESIRELKNELREIVSVLPGESSAEAIRMIHQDTYSIIAEYFSKRSLLVYYETQFDYTGKYRLEEGQIEAMIELIGKNTMTIPSNNYIRGILTTRGIDTSKLLIDRTILSEFATDEIIEEEEEHKGKK